MQAADNRRLGMTAGEARRAAATTTYSKAWLESTGGKRISPARARRSGYGANASRRIIFPCWVLGIAGGGLAAVGAARSAAKLLFAIQPADPTTYASIAILLMLAAALACYLPARRALRLDASRALRYE